MHPTRRDVLKGLAAVGGLSALSLAGVTRLAFAQDGADARQVLVVLHLRGGCDGLALVSPASDPDFIAARGSDLRVDDQGGGAGYALANGPDANIDFRLHKAAGGMNELYQGRNLAFIHACGLVDATRSHFVATDMIERGVGSEADMQRTEEGWIARAIADPRSGNRLQAVAVSNAVPGDLEGLGNVLTIPNLDYGLPYIGGPGVANALWEMYGRDGSAVGNAGRFALQFPAAIDARLPRDAQGHIQPYHADHDIKYDPAAELAQPLKTVAQLIKMDIGLQSITLDYGSWDTHEYQAGRFGSMVQKLSDGLSVFWNDISAYHDRVTLVTLTEFGRRLRSNASNGTDHGRGSLMTVLGGKVGGGKFYGRWPGLKSEQLDEGVDLAVTTDYRQVLTEILRQSRAKSDIFPNYRYPGDMGLFHS